MTTATAGRFNTGAARFNMVEQHLLDAFSEKTKHLKMQHASQMMQRELFHIALPFHEKLKEYGYKPEESRAMLRKAFDHKPPRTLGGTPKLHILGER